MAGLLIYWYLKSLLDGATHNKMFVCSDQFSGPTVELIPV